MWYVIVAVTAFVCGVIFSDLTKAETKQVETDLETKIQDEVHKLK